MCFLTVERARVRKVNKEKELHIALTGEGVTDYGWQEYASRQWHEGAAAKLIRACAEREGFDVSFIFVERKAIDSLKLQARQMQGLRGKAVPAKKFQLLMHKKGVSAGVYYCDADRASGTANNSHQAEKQFSRIRSDIQSIDDVGKTAEAVIPMVALRMIESWLLSDRNAFGAAFGNPAAPGRVPAFPTHPELLWGKEDDPNSDYPKNLFIRIFKAWKHGAGPTREDYAELAEYMDLDELSRKCPISFRTFLQDFRQFLLDFSAETVNGGRP